MSGNQSGGFMDSMMSLARKAEGKTKKLMSSTTQSAQNSQQQMYLQQQMYANPYQIQYTAQGMVRPVMTPVVTNHMAQSVMHQSQPGFHQIQPMIGHPTMSTQAMAGTMTGFQPMIGHPTMSTQAMAGTMIGVQPMIGHPTMSTRAMAGTMTGFQTTMVSPAAGMQPITGVINQHVQPMGQSRRPIGAPPMVIPMVPQRNAMTMPTRPVVNNLMSHQMGGRYQRPAMQTKSSSNAANVSGPMTMEQVGQMMGAFMSGGNEQNKTANQRPQRTSNTADASQEVTEEQSNPEEEEASGDVQTNTEADLLNMNPVENTSVDQEATTGYAQMNTVMDSMHGHMTDSSYFSQQAGGFGRQTNMVMGMEMQQQNFQGAFDFSQMSMETPTYLYGADMMNQGAMSMQFQMPTEFMNPMGGMEYGNMMNADCFGQMMDPNAFADMSGGYDMSTSGHEW